MVELAYRITKDWDFGVWYVFTCLDNNNLFDLRLPRDNWARTTSPNPQAKVYIGAPADSTAAGQGYVNASTLGSIATQMRKSFPSFGGVMLWDASQAYGKYICLALEVRKLKGDLEANGRYDVAIKNALSAAGGTGFTFPSCSAPAFVSGTNYAGGSQVSFDGK